MGNKGKVEQAVPGMGQMGPLNSGNSINTKKKSFVSV
jgi:hypothetical protein